MPFGLKNVGATYQRLVNKMFKDLIGKTMEVYIDDTVIKSKKKQDHRNDLQETFCIFEKIPDGIEPHQMGFWIVIRIVSRSELDTSKKVMEMGKPKTMKNV